MTTTPTPEQLDRATIDLIFALRDSITDDGPSLIDFWSGGRAISALEAAAAGASTGAEAVSLAARKLQIPQIAGKQAKTVTTAPPSSTWTMAHGHHTSPATRSTSSPSPTLNAKNAKPHAPRQKP